MDLVNILPSPTHIARTALSLLHSVVESHREPRRRYATIDFGIDSDTGFVPREPLPHLPEEYSLWEDALDEAPHVLCLGEDKSPDAMAKRAQGEQWRARVRSWPVLETETLHNSQRLLQRAHLVLAWMVHFYAHSIPRESEHDSTTVIPRSLAVPLVIISNIIGIAPVLCYADTVLWNWERINPDLPMTIDNMRPRHLFSGTDDELGFYASSVRTDLAGVELLRIIETYRNLPNLTDMTSICKVAKELTRLVTVVNNLNESIQWVRAHCDPHTFYWRIRPWYKGSDADGPNGPSWVYEGVPDSDKLPLSGPSAGQSTVMHALDVFLDVDHKLEKRRHPAPSTENKRAEQGFMTRMRRYMPGRHREYLEHLDALPTKVRDLATSTPALREPYNNCVKALKELRDLHMRIACLYIISMAKTKPPGTDKEDADEAERSKMARLGPVRGTGGNEVSLLLKAGRDATTRAIIPKK